MKTMSVGGLMMLVGVLGQTPARGPEAAAITAARQAIVHAIDPALPRETFETWLRGIVGAQADLKWEVNDCGEQTGDPRSDQGRDFPMCAQVQVALDGGRELNLLLVVGTFRQGLTAGAPRFHSGYLTEPGRPPTSVKSLMQVPAMIRRGGLDGHTQATAGGAGLH
jgi:hypothetical protein